MLLLLQTLAGLVAQQNAIEHHRRPIALLCDRVHQGNRQLSFPETSRPIQHHRPMTGAERIAAGLSSVATCCGRRDNALTLHPSESYRAACGTSHTGVSTQRYRAGRNPGETSAAFSISRRFTSARNDWMVSAAAAFSSSDTGITSQAIRSLSASFSSASVRTASESSATSSSAGLYSVPLGRPQGLAFWPSCSQPA